MKIRAYTKGIINGMYKALPFSGFVLLYLEKDIPIIILIMKAKRKAAIKQIKFIASMPKDDLPGSFKNWFKGLFIKRKNSEKTTGITII